MPLSFNGSLNGELNGARFNNNDLNFYVVTAEGRSYTGISKIPSSLGWHLQGLVPVGNVMAWLFALPKEGAVNGFSLTGGVLNYTAEVSYPGSGDSVTIKFVFNRMDDYLTAHISINGTVPLIPKGAELNISDHSREISSENFPGFIFARSSHSYEVRGSGSPPVVYFVKESIPFEWEGCTEENKGTMLLHASRNFILYDQNEQIVRYTTTGSVSPLEGEIVFDKIFSG